MPSYSSSFCFGLSKVYFLILILVDEDIFYFGKKFRQALIFFQVNQHCVCVDLAQDSPFFFLCLLVLVQELSLLWYHHKAFNNSALCSFLLDSSHFHNCKKFTALKMTYSNGITIYNLLFLALMFLHVLVNYSFLFLFYLSFFQYVFQFHAK